MLKWTIADRLMYTEYLNDKQELQELKNCKWLHDLDRERIKELEFNIEQYLKRCNEFVLRNIILWSLGIETDN